MESQQVSMCLAENNYNSMTDHMSNSPRQQVSQTPSQYQTLQHYSKTNEWNNNTMSVNLRNLSREETYSPDFHMSTTPMSHSHKVSNLP